MARRHLPLAIAIGMLLAPQAYALGLGAIEARSALEEPLLAEIPLVAVRAGELDELQVRLASGEDFRRAGVDRVGMLSQMEFELVFRGDTPYIRVTTPRAVREPFLNFLVEAQWSNGRMLREYTLLLDPPTFMAGDAPALSAPATQAPQLVQRDVPARAPTARSTRSEDAGAMHGGRSGRAASGDLEYGPTTRRDTLWRIAEQMRPDNSVSVHQMMIALQRENPEAFEGDNVNRLLAGHTLRIDNPQSITALSHREALAEFQAQTREWQQARQSGGMLRLVAPDSEVGETVGTRPGNQERSTRVAEAGDTPAIAAVRRDLDLALEGAEAERLRNTELTARLDELAEQMSSMQRLLALQDEEMAELQRQLAERAQQPSAATASAAPEPAAQPRVAAEPAPVAAPWYDTLPVSAPLAAGGVGLALLGALMWFLRRRRRGDFQESILAPVGADKGPNTEETSFLSDFAVSGMNAIHADDTEVDPLTEADVYMAYGRHEQAEELLNGALVSTPEREPLRAKLLELYHATRNAPAFLAQAQEYFSRHGEAEAPNWPRVAGMGAELMPDEPMFEGYSYQPEEHDPMELVSGSKTADVLDIGLDTGIFEADEFALSEVPNGGGLDLDLGQADGGSFADLDLGDLDFSQGDTPPAKPAAAPASTGAEFSELALTDDVPAGSAAEGPAPAAPEGDDLSMWAEPETETNAGLDAAPTTDDDHLLEFDMGQKGEEAAESAAASGLDTDYEPTMEAAMEFDGMSFEAPQGLDEDAPTLGALSDADAAWALDADASDAPAVEEEGLVPNRDQPQSEPQDQPADGFALTDQLDEVSTKLDLAQAYIDLGDPDGARDILQEVLEDGDETQQRTAEDLMRRIA